MTTDLAATPHRIPRRIAPAAPARPDATRHLRLVDPGVRARELRRRWAVRLWAVGIVVAALVGVTVHAFMAEAQMQSERLDAQLVKEQRRYEDARAQVAQEAAPAEVTKRAAGMGLVAGTGTRTVVVPGVTPAPSRARVAATAGAQSVKRVMEATP